MSRASKSTNKSSRTKSFRAAPSPHSSEDESPPVARSSNGRAPDNTPKSTKEKPSKPKQSRNRKVPPQNSVPTSHIDTSTDHAALGTTSRKRVQKKATTPKSKVAIVAKLPASHEDEGDGDANPAPARSHSKPSARTVQSLQSDSEQPCVLKKSTKGKVKVKSLEEVNPSSQGGRITAKKTTNRKTRGETNAQSDLDKGTTLETDAQASTSLGTKKRKKLPAPSTSNNLRVHLESDSEKHSPRSRSSSLEPPAKEPARKRHKARQAADDDGDKLPEEQESQIQNRRPSRKLGNAKDLKETREVSRSKAPPIPMPNGVRLKPKPRPRLSMFQPPPDDDTSDRDPIDFLS
ncbi:hypothetical protein GSI_11708 [Ganoderma sinense ZZ0214-1]|uniref:Uncharacterized protein n=1 Tax=Ganoderma sinense ZZ0214-1 TaxID=1077348 RepID=A0A2G8RWU5_9APHY|nr:hypothetical protein GSI_11708 [Ganoderma sinense ZZ0214-1]